MNSALEATFRRELRNSLRTEMFSFVHPEGVSYWEPASKTPDNFRTYISLQIFKKVFIRNPFPPLHIEMFQQQIVELYLKPLLDSFFGYNKIKVEGAIYQKTNFITN